MTLILASGSPRRRDLLREIGLDFEVITSDVEEIPGPGESVHEYVRRLAREKAEAVGSARPDRWVIAADTVVQIDGMILEKPKDPADAARMLGQIAGRWHTVFTGVALLRKSSDDLDCRIAESRVSMMPLSTADIGWYVATGEPMDKAGSYAVQGIGAMFIDAIEGSYTNVVGLPLSLLFRMLRDAGVDPIEGARAEVREGIGG